MAVALVAVGLLVGGCGGGGKSPGVANVSTSTTSSSHSSSSSSSSTANGDGGTPLSGGAPSTGSGPSGQRSNFAIQTGNPQKALQLSECMRANGVPNFPDPNGQGLIQGSGIDPNTPGFQKAQKACAKKIGGGVGTRSPAQIAQQEAAALKFSQCMRSHGVSDFPDPQFSSGGGGVSIKISAHAGGGSSSDLDPNSPIFQKAQKTCGSLLPGRAGQKVGP